MTNRERQFAALGFSHAACIDECERIELPMGRYIQRVDDGWAAQPWDDNYWRTFDDLLDAVRFATHPTGQPK